MEIVENTVGAVAGAAANAIVEGIVKNPVCVAVICFAAVGYGIYKLGEAAVAAVPDVLDASADAISNAYHTVVDEVNTIMEGKPATIRTIPIHEG